MREMLRQINWKSVALLAVAAALVAAYAKLFVVVLLIAAVVGVSLFVQHFHLRLFGIELVTFATVLIGVAYGPLAGAIMGLVLVLVQLVMSGYFGIYYLWVIPEYIIAGYMVSRWAGPDIAGLGLGVVLAMQAANLALTYIFDRYSFFNHIVYTATNIAFNAAAFFLLGPAVLAALR